MECGGESTNMKGRVAVILAVAVVAVGVVVYFYLLRPGIDIGPVPSGWERTNETKLDGGDAGVRYVSSGSPEKALATFQAGMEEAGWSHLGGSLQDSFLAEFVRGAERATVFAVGDGPDISVYVLVSDALSVTETGKPGASIGEVDGNDLADVPRYPDSVRTSYEDSPQELLLEYLARASVPTVVDFYAGRLPQEGWVIQAMTMDEGAAHIIGTRPGRGILTMDIGADSIAAGETIIRMVLLAVE